MHRPPGRATRSQGDQPHPLPSIAVTYFPCMLRGIAVPPRMYDLPRKVRQARYLGDVGFLIVSVGNGHAVEMLESDLTRIEIFAFDLPLLSPARLAHSPHNVAEANVWLDVPSPRGVLQVVTDLRCVWEKGDVAWEGMAAV